MPHPTLPEHLPITVEARDETGRIVELIARCANVTVARGAFEAARTCRQGVEIMIRDRSRVIAAEFLPVAR
ncbi:hypothetical protein [Pannonibacter sp. SL95]|uniref:hypothetical protein n=1 Tax=Pannonibacter sp. SL95 TaxID=2995153 RepID=UPI0022749A7F|nr:hypothetical protein [Pannonibacter sp. SL95]MCY1707689.1 hypothetical protein [Pannonibacter sp. SL95]MCY1707751.1 hypothetical protein [Pannonibacter sp. SL95]